MASDSIDAQSLKSWQDAFQYPIPSVRRVEQELRRDIASNKEKLRALVGTRYRELVGTAENIVSMNREMEEVDTTLADIGRRCNPRLMGKNYAHYNQINGEITDYDASKRAFAAQLALLHRCSVLMSKMLRKRRSPLLMAKLFVISGLLHKTLSEHKPAPPFLETLRNQLASVKSGLRNRINKCLARAQSSVDEVIEALAAYCLATRSSSDDAVAYYHKIRLEVIGNQVELAEASGDSILSALRLYVQTLQVSKAVLSRRFTDVLGKLKSRPLFVDPEVRNIDDLALDVLGRWVATDITNFTPWIKLNEVSKQDMERTIKMWSKTAFDEFVRRCHTSLASWVDFTQLLELRRQTLELWLCSWSSTPTHSTLQVLEGIRTVFNGRLTNILSDQAKALDVFGQAAGSAISHWDNRAHGDTQSLWDPELISLDYSNGAGAFKEAVTDRLLGRDEKACSVLEKYRDWLLSIGVLREAIDALRDVRWPDIIDEAADENLDIDVAAILNEDDRELLWEALKAAVGQAFDALQISLSGIYQSLGDTDRGEKAGFVLKLIRLVRRDLPYDIISSDVRFSKDIVPGLQDVLATEVIKQTRPLTFPLNPGSKPVAGRTLWEGEPELPIQPSPFTFKFLRRMVQSMDRFGPGLWDTSSVHTLQGILQRVLAEQTTSFLEGIDSSANETQPNPADDTPIQNGDNNHPVDSANEAQNLQDFKLQLYFDVLFLGSASTNTEAKQNPLKNVAEMLRDCLGSQAEQTSKTMDQRAQDYWSRTRLLFGLLAVDTLSA